MDQIIGKTFGGCVLQSLIGQGGMGAVYRAHHEGLDIPVAVKVMNPISGIDHAQERFIREARAAARIRHTNIVGVLNVGFEHDLHFIVMEYVEGQNLHSFIKQYSTLSIEQAAPMMLQLLDALQAVMDSGIVHRDIKPENILVDGGGNVKLADLGLARICGDLMLTQSSTVLGSPYYVAPEQAESPVSADIRADIYSLGCTFFQMLTGRAPYQGASVMEIVLAHLNKPIPRASDLNKSVDRAISEIIEKMMQKSPAQRYQTPRQVRKALEQVLQPSIAGSVRPSSQISKKVLTGSVLAILALAIIALVLLFKNGGNQFTSELPEYVDYDTVAPVQENYPRAVLPEVSEPRETLSKPSVQSGDPLRKAVMAGDTVLLARLLRKGTNPNGDPADPATPLLMAVKKGAAPEAFLLLSYGANPSKPDSEGNAPLHYALRSRQTAIAKMLLEKGANPNMADGNGKTPLQIARMMDPELMRLLKSFGAN